MRPARLRNIPFWYVGKFQKILSSASVTYIDIDCQKGITTHHVHGWAVQNDITWPHVHLLTVGWSRDLKSRKVWGGQVAPRMLPRISHMLRWFLFKLKIWCKYVMLGPSIMSFSWHLETIFLWNRLGFQKRCIHIIHASACRIQIYKFKQGKNFQCRWAISTAAIQLLIGVGHRGQPDGPPRNTAMYDTEPKNWPMVVNPWHQDLRDVSNRKD